MPRPTNGHIDVSACPACTLFGAPLLPLTVPLVLQVSQFATVHAAEAWTCTNGQQHV